MKARFQDRIARLNTVAAAITIALVFAVVYIVVSVSAYGHLDGDIRDEREEVMSNLDQNDSAIIIMRMPEWEEAEHKQVEVNPTFIQVVDARGVSIFRSANLRDDHFLYEPTEEQERFFNAVIDGQRIRQGQFVIPNKAGTTIGYLTIGVSQEESYAVLHNLLLTVLLLYPLVLLVLYVSSSIAARTAIKPVHALIDKASVITSANLADRLSLPSQKNEFHQLAGTINALLDRIELSFRQQKQFTADASHEMRTPLAGMRGTLEVLIRQPRTPEHYENRITGVIGEVDRLEHLLDQLLELARLDASTAVVKRARMNVSEAVRATQAKKENSLQERGMKWMNAIPSDARVDADPFMLDVILDNLLGNAIKYGRAKGMITVAWDPATCTLSISDDGEGIPAEHLPHIFERFYRADQSRSAQVPGQGLGLSIVKKMADLQGIAIGASSEAGKGTRFDLRFPA
ncbi:MAG: ATP-binding protein [Flavobacteriales bacterium]